MPEIRYYTVIQTREVKIWANDPLTAAEVADGAFRGREDIPITHGEGGVIKPVRYRDLAVKEDRL